LYTLASLINLQFLSNNMSKMKKTLRCPEM
jgi:hypothetical protein